MKALKSVARKEARKVVGGFGTSAPIHTVPPPWRPKRDCFFRKIT
jgi:hypothetical protein